MSIRDDFENLAETEWLEHYYGLDQRCDDTAEIRWAETRGLDDPVEYRGYRWDSFSDFGDFDLPWKEFIPKCRWEEIPF